MSSRPVGVLGGIFDPVHNGHLAAAMLARDHFALDRVIFIPSGTPPHKNSVYASASDRLNMLKLAVGDVPEFSVWEGEVFRDGCSYTIETLEILHDSFGDSLVHFIIGSDNLTEIPTWHRYEQILQRVTLCVASRPGYPMTNIPSALADARLETFPSPEWGLSSTQIRSYLNMSCSCRFLIPDAVLGYIKEKNLYGYQNR